MLLNFDRKRLYIFGSVGLVLLLLLAFYHAPNYVPAEVSRMKTSVSTWLKGTEPSLSDETYKDSPHFSPPTKGPEQEQSKPTTDKVETLPAHDAPTLQIVGDDNVDLLPPYLASSQPSTADAATPSATPSNQLPDANDFVAVLPPVDVISSTSAAAASEHTYSLPTPTDPRHTYSLPAPTEAAAKHTYSLPDPDLQYAALHTTLTTHVKPTTTQVTDTQEQAFDEEKWYI